MKPLATMVEKRYGYVDDRIVAVPLVASVCSWDGDTLNATDKAPRATLQIEPDRPRDAAQMLALGQFIVGVSKAMGGAA